jgi:threonyl-tRNA synthetase
MVHRAVLGSLERFVGGLIEHYAGAFPLWLAPTQVIVIPISDRHTEAAKKVVAMLNENEIRVQLDDRSETIKYRIREAQVQQTPYMVVLGDKEVEEGIVAVRHRRQADLGTMTPEALLAKLKAEIASKESI